MEFTFPNSSLCWDMRTISKHDFGGEEEEEEEDGDEGSSSLQVSNSPPEFTITIIEVMQEDNGMFVWPCSIVLAEYVWQQRTRFAGINVVEVGSGTSLPGLVASKVGANVTLTDNADSPEVLGNIREICATNNVNCKVVSLTWGVWDQEFLDLKPQIILGADVLYVTKDFDDLFATVAFLLTNSPGAVFITTYENRSGHHLIEYLMMKWRLQCIKLVDAYTFMPSSKMAKIKGSIELAEIKLDSS